MWSLFMSQIVMLVLTLCVCLPLLIWYEWRKGNDLTMQDLGKVVGTLAFVGCLGIFSLVVLFFLWKWPPDEVEWEPSLQPNSIYEIVGNKTILLRGSQSAKVYRALMSSEVEF